MRVLILDCRELFRGAVKSVIGETVAGVHITEIEGLGSFFRSTSDVQHYDLVIICPDSFGQDGSACLSLALRVFQDPPFLVLTSEADPKIIDIAKQDERISKLPLNVSKAALSQIIKSLLMKNIIPRDSYDQGDLDMNDQPSRTTDLSRNLSRRQRQIMVLIASGLSNMQIAIHLGISIGTVKSHNHMIYRMLDVNSRTKAVLEYQKLSLLSA